MKTEYWKVLKFEVGLPEAMRILNPNGNGDAVMKEIGRDPFAYHSTSLMMARIAYDALVESGEINGDEIYCLQEKCVHGSYGFSKNDTFVWHEKWISISKSDKQDTIQQ